MVATDGFGSNTTAGEEGSEDSEDSGGFNGFQPLEIEKLDVVTQRDGPQSGYDISFPQGIMWGIMGCLSTFALSLVTERNQGTLSRLLLSDVSRDTILAGKALACFITILFIATCLLILGNYLGNHDDHGNDGGWHDPAGLFTRMDEFSESIQPDQVVDPGTGGPDLAAIQFAGTDAVTTGSCSNRYRGFFAGCAVVQVAGKDCLSTTPAFR